MILISFEDLQKIHNFSKLQGCGSKIGSATPIWISKFKRAWQAQFLSYNLETLEKWVFFEDVQMILVSFFHIPAGFQLRKNLFESAIQVLSNPCSRKWKIIVLKGQSVNYVDNKGRWVSLPKKIHHLKRATNRNV